MGNCRPCPPIYCVPVYAIRINVKSIVQSRTYWNEVFSKILNKPSMVQKWTIPHKAKLNLIGKKWKTKLFDKPKNQIQKLSFSSSTNIQFTIWEQFLQFKAFKSVEIDAIGIEVILLLKMHFYHLKVKWHFVGQPDVTILSIEPPQCQWHQSLQICML